MNHTATYSPEDDKLRLYPACRLSKEDYDRAKAAGFRWAPMQELFFAVWTPKAEDLLLEWCEELADEDKSLAERAEERAERFEDYRDARKEDAERAHAAVSAIADNIPLDQPILVGHHSERHARRDAEKIENGMRRAVNAWKTSQYWQDRAAGALRHAKYKELPGVRARRIKTLEADLRQQIANYTPETTKDRPKPQVMMQQRWRDCYPLDGSKGNPDAPEVPHVWVGPHGRGGRWVPVEDLPAIEAGSKRYREHLEFRIAYERALLEEAGETKLLDRKPRSAVAQLPLCNYRAPGGLEIENRWRRGEMIHYGQVEMSQADYAKIHADYKGTRVVGNSHRVRISIRGGVWSCVFITDSKAHVPPPAEPTLRQAASAVRAGTWSCSFTPREADPEKEKFENLQKLFKAGVQVVSANQLFPTPHDLAQRMADLADIQADSDILEPSAGIGSLIDGITQPFGHLTAIEINPTLADRLRQKEQSDKVTIRCVDFIETQFEIEYDRVLMNPPFENGADIKHIQHAIRSLKAGGRLVAICANGPRQQDKLKPLADTWEELPAGTFGGTGVRAALMVYDAPKTPGQQGFKVEAIGGISLNKPMLAENHKEAMKQVAAGRTWPSLKESKTFDAERLTKTPLFERGLF